MTFATTPLAIGPGIPVDARLPRIAPLSGTRMAAQGSFSDQLAAARERLERPAQAPDVPIFDPHLVADGLAGDAAGVLARIKSLFEQAAKAAPQGQNGLRQGSPDAPLFSRLPMPRSGSEDGVGGLSARFESAGKGIEAIGYDEVGGTSYGKFQIASRVGSMDRFVDYLKDKAPDWGNRLKNAGPANTKSTSGAMPAEWKKIAAENPKRFEQLQNNFIRDTYYSPAMDKVLERTGVDIKAFPPALKEVLWSTAVQHGPTGAADIFSRAISKMPEGQSKEFAKGIIQEVYAGRKTQFGSSTEAVQAGVKNRLANEQDLAMGMLGSEA